MLIGRSYGGKDAMSTPSRNTFPDVGFSKPAIILSKVDLPQPELPNNAKISPFWMEIETSSTAMTSSNRFTKLSVRKNPW